MSARKFAYYLGQSLKFLVPPVIHRALAQRLITTYHQEAPCSIIEDRVNYYNKVDHPFRLTESQSTQVQQFRKTGGTTYFFDLRKVIKGYLPHNRFCYINGDVRNVPPQPSFLKSRPVGDDNVNSVLLKLNEVRHFHFVNDTLPFKDKKNMVVWRGLGKKPHRKVVLEQFYNHPKCNIGRTKPKEGTPLEKGFLSIEEQLKYKFILAIEGNDVATNLKWAMSSNSLVIMSKPKFETWFMEGRLKAGVHYVEVKDDYSDLIEKVDYYTTHTEAAEQIIHNAHLWVEQFKDQKRERLISYLVAEKYFSNQRLNEMSSGRTGWRHTPSPSQ
ncbi:glycosyl transferase family 90 [Vibrio sp. WXL210]|uniref:glycosyl transferase family 90 n=1 Tax=Vibrio sp. WXL210 TaxID=3450709 RepID=UPI003EC8E5B7